MITITRSLGLGIVFVAGVAGTLLAYRPVDAALLGTEAVSAASSAVSQSSTAEHPHDSGQTNLSAAVGLVNTRAVLDQPVATSARQGHGGKLTQGAPPTLRAALLSTRSVVNAPERSLSPREKLLASFQREDMQAGLEAYGVSLEEARARVESLTDDEILQIAGDLDQLPAGGHTPPVEMTFVGHPLNPAAWVVNIGKVVFGILTWMFGGGTEDGSYDPA